jgi:Flp pilus assembly protein TadG
MNRIISRKESGNSLIELALAVPLLLLMLLGTADFGRLFYESIAVENAARCGTQFAVVSTANHNNLAGIQQAALNDLPVSASASALATKVCRCGWGAENDCSTTCSSKRTYIRVRVQKTFTPLVPYPGIPSSVLLRADSIMRIK